MNHRIRFSTSGNHTKRMPIGYLSLWVQPRSLTLGDLSWPWTSSGAFSRFTSSHVLTPISSTIPIQVNRTTPKLRLLTISLKSCRWLFLLWRHNFVTWPDPTIFFHQKLRKGCPISYGKCHHDSLNGVASQLRKSHGGLHQPPPDRARVKTSWTGSENNYALRRR